MRFIIIASFSTAGHSQETNAEPDKPIKLADFLMVKVAGGSFAMDSKDNTVVGGQKIMIKKAVDCKDSGLNEKMLS